MEKRAVGFNDIALENIRRYNNHPAVLQMQRKYHNPDKVAYLYDADKGNRATVEYDPEADPDNAEYLYDENTIRLPSNDMRGAFPHEEGHMKRNLLGLDDKYFLGATRQRQKDDPDTLWTDKVMTNMMALIDPDYPADKKLRRLHEIRSQDIMEVGASGFGAQENMKNGMSEEDAYNNAFAGVPTYRLSQMLDLNLFNDQETNALYNTNSTGIHRPVAYPAYTQEEQINAIADEYNKIRMPGSKLLANLGKRPAGFENDGKWVPGMEPVTDQEWALYDTVHNTNSLSNLNFFRKRRLGAHRNIQRAFLRGDRDVPVSWDSLKYPESYNREYVNKRLAQRTNKGYRTLADMGTEYANLFANGDDLNKFNYAVNAYKKNPRADLYLDSNRNEQEVPRFYNTVRGFYPDRTVPTRQTKSYIDRINDHDSTVFIRNQRAYYANKRAGQ